MSSALLSPSARAGSRALTAGRRSGPRIASDPTFSRRVVMVSATPPASTKASLEATTGAAQPTSAEAEAAQRASSSTSSTGDLVKETLLQTVKGEATTAKDVLGEGTVAQLKQALGEERAAQFLGALDGLLANRRLATLIFAVVDVALIWVLIKVFKSTILDHQ